MLEHFIIQGIEKYLKKQAGFPARCKGNNLEKTGFLLSSMLQY